LLTLVQTGKMKPLPILLFGADYWNRIINFDELVAEGVINAEDINLFTWVETAEDAWREIVRFYDLDCG
ncbi:MAG: LOG family protein, partial [Novosphingobium sp.]